MPDPASDVTPKEQPPRDPMVAKRDRLCEVSRQIATDHREGKVDPILHAEFHETLADLFTRR